MISTPDHQNAVTLISDATAAGACRRNACAEVKISERSLRRWIAGGAVHADQRPLIARPEPPNKLTDAERQAVLDVCNSKDFSSLPPSQIVPRLADQGQYLASDTNRQNS